AAGADDGLRSDGHTRTEDRSAAHPHVGADGDRLAKLLRATKLSVHRMRGGVDLYRWPEEGEITDPDFAYIEHHAIEVEVDPLAEMDVAAVVAVERWLHPDSVAAAAKQFLQNLATQLLVA